MTISRPSAWVALDGMFYPIFERDLALVERIFKTALLKISHNSYLNGEIRRSRLPIDFYETAFMDYEKICPFKPLMGMNGLENCKDGDVVFWVDFGGMKVWAGIWGISKDMGGESVKGVMSSG
jgi:hypothetical protein